jgi:chloramphenicol-sensitive protein RarD
MTQTKDADSPLGVGLAISAYLLWGLMPLYMKMLSHIDPFEVVAHRVIWSVPIAGLVLVLLGRTADLRSALVNPRMLLMGAVTATLISINWAIYLWAISTERTIDAALGYYINPLFSVFCGAVLLGEPLGRMQKLAIVIAGVAVGLLTWISGGLPWAAIGLTFSWGCYALAKKTLPIGPNQGFMLEVLLLLPVALIYVVVRGANGVGHFETETLLLIGCGAVTAAPLLLYASGAKLLRLSTIGVMGFIAPTLIFLVAVFAFGEEIDLGRMIALPLIWVALIIYTLPMLRRR